MSIADLRKTQDCVLMGRRDCAQISVAAVELDSPGTETAALWPMNRAHRHGPSLH